MSEIYVVRVQTWFGLVIDRKRGAALSGGIDYEVPLYAAIRVGEMGGACGKRFVLWNIEAEENAWRGGCLGIVW